MEASTPSWQSFDFVLANQVLFKHLNELYITLIRYINLRNVDND
jgi:hypothetical protein